MEQVRTIVVDDEPEALEGAVALLRRDPEIALVGECSNGAQAVDLIRREHPELVLLDVQMPDLDGFGVLNALDRARTPVIVFMTAYDAYALRAFDAHAVDYLLKPFSDPRFGDALSRAKEQVRQRRVGQLGEQLAALFQVDSSPPSGGSVPLVPHGEGAPSPVPALPAGQYLERILVRHNRRISFVAVQDIDWIGAEDYYARLYVAGRTHLVRETMQQLEAKLDPKRFVRIHRSAIVNVDRVDTIEPYIKGGYVIRLRDKSRLTLSRSRRETLERALGQHL